ncbi:thermonuclease family protein [uncultured Deinococcus sp.]|uniref:thermonuclease family protein n=1 Tax=uncultured Deinococcus sp. TaxID=158789 RepID=UPI0025FBDDF2|nr:thermonuclease family protein [uncultured Deinococcus sp.]
MSREALKARRRTQARTRALRWSLVLLVVVVGAGVAWLAQTPDSPVGRRPTPPRGTLTGAATVIDGDTLDIAGTRVRLYGIDAPESAQTCRRAGRTYACGQEAVTALRGLLGGQAVTCQRRDTDRYGRTVAVCRVGGTDVNAWMVSRGHALAYREYGTDYVPQENEARKAKRGMHAGTYVNPADYRSGDTTPATAAAPARRTPYASCAQARAAGRTPVLRGEGGYNVKLDGDGDGKMCE